MSVKDLYTEDEWFLLTSTPGLVGAAMAFAGRSGPIGTVKEFAASLSALASAGKDYPDNELISEIVAKTNDRQEAKERLEQYQNKAQERYGGKSPEELKTLVTTDLREVDNLLARKSTPEEAREYKNWTLNVAQEVAHAAKEGSVLGFGGEEVSEAERTLLEEVKAVLNMPGPTHIEL